MMDDVTLVIPTIGRASLQRLLGASRTAPGPGPRR